MAGKLTRERVRSLTEPGRYGDGGGLWLQVRGAENKSWVFRYMLAGRARWAGLGPVELVSLDRARRLAIGMRQQLLDRIDPLAHRRAARASKPDVVTFATAAEAYFRAHQGSWKSRVHRHQWRASLDAYALPILGDLDVAAIDAAAVLQVIGPLWDAKRETATRIRARIETVLSFAASRGWRSGENPARWKGHLDFQLARKVAVKHLAAVPFPELPALMAQLLVVDTVGARCLEFIILTAARLSEAADATWDEIDLPGAVWTIPGGRMKAGQEHRVPLSPPAIAILERQRLHGGEHVFPGRAGGPIGGRSVLATLKQLGRAETVHGMRSSFRTWAAESTEFPRETIERALAHRLGDATERAYDRGDQFEKRRRLMNDWSGFCAGGADSSAPSNTFRLIKRTAGWRPV